MAREETRRTDGIESVRIPVGDTTVTAVRIDLIEKSLILLRGRRGYIMCGYLDLSVADRFAEAAVRIVGVSSIEEALAANAAGVSREAARLGIRDGQPVREILRIIA